ncbi:rapamycin-insensitive companion of mTOR isoform X2 [Venturia canescens]|uniref:rapamycin-insensitive companion of mTOR isoform X2 n=1 Tax=Venturia canescens TaxID=32260 RepID=UPI001C9C1531|nr:rapamycin-insensitive companion of mTOR isoform X2 [Venturia canescens]
MAISSWMIWGRSLRTNRTHRSQQDHESSCVQLDLSKELKENIRDVLTHVCQRQGIASVKKLAYLNAVIRLICENNAPDYGYCTEEVFCCLRVALVNEATQVRAAALRAVRYMLKSENDVMTLNKLHYPYFVARSMDINLRNDMERMQALRLVRRILVIAPRHFSPVLARSLISLTNGGIEERERTFRVFLATVCELGVLNSSLLISCGGVGALARSAMTVQSPAIIESVVGVLLHLLDNPETRGSVSLLCLASPYCELHSLGQDRTKETREMRFAARLKAIVEILYVDQLEVRGAVLEFLYELLGLPLPMWTDEPDVALAAVDPSRPRETWKLSEGFVAAEGKSILPSFTSRCPNIMEVHLALLVYVLLQCGLHHALTETVLSSDTFISVRAAVLLGILLHLAHSLLPSDVCDLTPPLPNLLEHASTGRHQALAAVAILGRIHAIMRRRLTPASLFLDRILQAGTWLRPTLPRRAKTSSRTWLRRESPTTPLLKDAQVLSSKDALAWNWPVIRSILRSREDSLRILHDSDHRVFIKRLVRYFKPSSNRYSRVELGTNATLAREATLAGCDLVNCLLEMNEPEGTRLLNELIGDIAEQIAAITSSPSAHDCLFSPRHMTTTCCQKYFLFLGQLSHSAKGTVILKGFNLLDKLQDLALATNHDCYVKLIVSSLDYSRDGPNRKVMSTIISEAAIENTRLYATLFLRLILSAKMIDAHQWAIALLCSRIIDNSKLVASAALDILHDACNEPEYLEVLFHHAGRARDWNDWLRHLGDNGYLLKIRMYALRTAFTSFSSPTEELERWIKPDGFAERYVGLVEGQIHDSMTRRQRDENGTYLRRSTNMLVQPKDIFVPPHLIGQLVQHELGVQLILRRNVLQRFARIVQRFKLESTGPSDGIAETKTRGGSRNARSTFDEGHVMSEGSGAEDNTSEPNRLETIIDAEIMETIEIRTPKKTESMIEIPRKFSIDDSQRVTPEIFIRDKQSGGLEDRILKVKAALWALGHAGTSSSGVEQLNHLGVIEMITSIAETCQYYTVRATALYTLSLIGTTRAGADSLVNFDWLCVRYKRGDQWPVVKPTNPYPPPSPLPVQRHHRSLSDGKPEIPEPIARRTRNRSESAATDIEAKRYALPERGETPSPVSSVQRLSQQDADGYARLRSLQRHRRPSYSHSSLEMYSSDGRLSLQSLSEFESSRSWTTDNGPTLTPPPARSTEKDTHGPQYMGICLPRKLTMIFSDQPRVPSTHLMDDLEKSSATEPTNQDEEFGSECDADIEHSRVCLVCYQGKSGPKEESIDESEKKLRREILRHTQRLSNPVWYRYSRQPLLRLRQRYPEKFQDTCLFSEVAARLGCGTYRLPARRFLQELFLESPFDALYKEPMIILKMPIGTEENPAQMVTPFRHGESYRLSGLSPSARTLNGRLTIAETGMEQQQEMAFESTRNKEDSGEDEKGKTLRPETGEVVKKRERLSDEKIIAEILKPAEMLQISKSSTKLLKVTGTNTAISLD